MKIQITNIKNDRYNISIDYLGINGVISEYHKQPYVNKLNNWMKWIDFLKEKKTTYCDPRRER